MCFAGPVLWGVSGQKTPANFAMGYEDTSLAQLATFIYAAGHVALFLLGGIFGWQK